MLYLVCYNEALRQSSLFVKTFVNWGGGGGVRYHRQYNLLTYIITVFRSIVCLFFLIFSTNIQNLTSRLLTSLS